MKDQEIYQKLGELLWSIMNENAHIIFCEGYIYSDATSYSFEWIESNNRIGWFDFDAIPHEIGGEIINLIDLKVIFYLLHIYMILLASVMIVGQLLQALI